MPRFSLLAALLVALPASAQADFAFTDTAPPPHVCVLMAEPHAHREAGTPTADDLDTAADLWRASAAPASHVVVTEGPAATFVVTYTGFDAYPDAEAAYQSAVDLWATHVASAVPIVVTAEFLPLGTGVLGAAGPFLIRNFAGAPRTNVWYPFALADAIAGTNLAPGGTDIQSRFSSNFSNWYFGTDGLPPASKYDFRSVVLHELGHGLGFSGSARWDDGATAGRCDAVLGNGCWGYNGNTFGGSAQIFDVLVEAGDGTPLLDTGVYANPSAALGTLLLSRDVWVRGPRIGALPATERGKLWAPVGWQAGSSYSHWDESLYPRGSANAPMSPQIGPGESFSTPGPLTCAFFADMGWPLGAGCAQFVDAEAVPGATEASALQIVGANPFATSTRLRLTLDAPQTVEAVLYDVTGRRVRTLFDGAAPAGPLTIELRADGLAPGVYAVRAITGASLSEARVVVAR